MLKSEKNEFLSIIQGVVVPLLQIMHFSYNVPLVLESSALFFSIWRSRKGLLRVARNDKAFKLTYFSAL